MTSTDQSQAPNSAVPETKICVFCGASPGSSPIHLEAARSLAQTLHQNNISLVYGGGTTGIMGELARTLVALSGPSSVHGIIPETLVKYERPAEDADVVKEASANAMLEHGGESVYGRTTIVDSIHERKMMMAKEVMKGGPGSGFVALSGGYGTLEELMEITTWNQIGIHERGVVVFNVEGFWDGLFKWIGTAVEAGFVKSKSADIMLEAKSSEEVVRLLKEYKASSGRYNLDWEKI